MNSSENNIRDFIIIGGCHVSGFGAEGSPSFVDVVESKLNLKCVYKKSLFQLKNAHELTSILDQYSTNLVFLQVGNYEFMGSLKTSLSKYKKTTSVVCAGGEPDIVKDIFFSEGHSWLYFYVVYILKCILMPFIWMYAKRKNSKYLLLLQKIILNNSDKTFVIISPLPCYWTSSSIVRKKAGVYYKRLFSIQNVIFVNSFDEFEIVKKNFYNQHHLSARGHEQLGQIVVNKVLSKTNKS